MKSARQMKAPCCRIADFKSYNKEFNEKKGEKTIEVADQKPSTYGFQVCCSFHTTKSTSEHFVTTITGFCKEMANEHENTKREHGYT